MEILKANKEIIGEKDVIELSTILELIEDIKFRRNLYPSLKEVSEIYTSLLLLKLEGSDDINIDFITEAFGVKNFQKHYKKMLNLKKFLLDNHIYLVEKIALYYTKDNKESRINLMQEGMIGLERAILGFKSYFRDRSINKFDRSMKLSCSNFNTDKINTFSKYAFGTIVGSIIQAISWEEYLNIVKPIFRFKIEKLISCSISFSEKHRRRPNLIEIYKLMGGCFASFDIFEDFILHPNLWELPFKYEYIPIEDASEIVALYKTIFNDSLDYATIRFTQRRHSYFYRRRENDYFLDTKYHSNAWLGGDISKVHYFIDYHNNGTCSIIS
ncbi:hypothetical protein [Prochlorococcus sp. MIT 1341]|uniref:hypothetical protein n=1 Tax=Prochlorococcus sp. MIT 1341 TaxID=3096221 RepID=UPI002A75E62D|nr:hypothetical protein [Prochlorococcus sp. MIT 1341]